MWSFGAPLCRGWRDADRKAGQKNEECVGLTGRKGERQAEKHTCSYL